MRTVTVRWGLVVLLAAALVAQSYRAWRLLTASRILRAVEAVTVALGGQGRVAPPLLVHNLELLERAARLDPANAAILLGRGSQLLLLRRPEEAVAAYRAALELEPRAEIYLNLGRALRSLGRTAQADAARRKAMLLHPGLGMAASMAPAATSAERMASAPAGADNRPASITRSALGGS